MKARICDCCDELINNNCHITNIEVQITFRDSDYKNPVTTKCYDLCYDCLYKVLSIIDKKKPKITLEDD